MQTGESRNARKRVDIDIDLNFLNKKYVRRSICI